MTSTDTTFSAPVSMTRFFIFLAALIGLLGMALSCSPREVAAQEPRPAGTPRKGGVLRLAQEAPRSLDPADADSVYDSLPVSQIFDGLVATDAGMRIIPALASTWTISRDGRVYTFHLRPDVRFHDGSLLTAGDVVFTFERLLSPEHTKGSIASAYIGIVSGARERAEGKRRDLTGVEALDAHTVRITLDRPYLPFLQVLALDGLRVIPAALIRREGDPVFDHAPVGTGPFRLDSWTSERIRLTANADYFGGAPHLDAVEINFLRAGEQDSGAERFYRGEIDILQAPVEDQIPRLSRDPRVRLRRYQELNLTFVGLGLGHPPLDDVRIRQAIAHAIDRKGMIDQSPQTRRLATGILPPGIEGYSPLSRALDYDLAESRRLLAEAGHPGGRGLDPIEFLMSSRGLAAVQIAQSIRSNLADVGIRLEIRPLSWQELNERIDEKKAAMFRLSWVADLNDPDSFLRSLFESGGVTNYFDFRDPESQALLQAGARETNPIQRARIYRQAEQRILELVPIVPLYYPVTSFVSRDCLHDLMPGPLGVSLLDFEKAWFASKDECP